jgi:hypothetical protein
MLSHVLAGRREFSLGALSEGLGRIGYTLRILPAPATQPIVRKQKQSG